MSVLTFIQTLKYNSESKVTTTHATTNAVTRALVLLWLLVMTHGSSFSSTPARLIAQPTAGTK